MKKDNLYSIWNEAVSAGGAAVLWRLPHSDDFHFIADTSFNPAGDNLNIEESGFGFAVSPFLNPAGAETLFLRADVYSVFGRGDFASHGGSVVCHYGEEFDSEVSDSRQHYIDMVEKALAAIAAGELDKVVPSRTMRIALSADFNPIRLLAELSRKYPAAFVSLISLPGVGTWLGASPELLVEVSDAELRTVSLAGTQPYLAGVEPEAVLWRQKEIEEQAMVSRYIFEQFKTLRMREFSETGPETVRAGNMLHLKTEYRVDLARVNYPGLGTEMLRLLHPTSAVCGMPRENALRFIAANEALDRGLYSGYLGPVNYNGASRLYVNLRCMRIFEDSGVVYAGAGVTHGSNAGMEWDETVLKCQSLLSVMNHE